MANAHGLGGWLGRKIKRESGGLRARAEALVKEYEIACFWFWHPEVRVRYLDDVRQVVHHLREYGNHKAWQAAQELNKCL